MSILNDMFDKVVQPKSKPVKWTVMKKLYDADHLNGRYLKVIEYDHNPADYEIDTDCGVGQYQIRAFNDNGKSVGQEPLLVGSDQDITLEREMQLKAVAAAGADKSGDGLGGITAIIDELSERADEVAHAEEALAQIKEVFGGGKDNGSLPVDGIFDGYSKGLGNAIYSGLQKQDKEVANSALKLFEGFGEIVSGVGTNLPQILQICAHVAGAKDIEWNTSENETQVSEEKAEEIKQKATAIMDRVTSAKGKGTVEDEPEEPEVADGGGGDE